MAMPVVLVALLPAGRAAAAPPPAGAGALPSATHAAPSVASATPPGLPIVVVDPGHGGDANGARASCGVWEKEVALAIALKTAELVEESGLAHALLTRTTDVAMPLEARVAFANAAQAHAFVSIHANASSNGDATGVETFFLSHNAASHRFDKLLDRENEGKWPRAAVPRRALSVVLSGLALDALEAQSQRLAFALHKHLAGRSRGRGRGVLQAPFVVLMGSKVPAALAEVGFLTNAEECLRLTNPDGQDQVAESLAAGIFAYLAARP